MTSDEERALAVRIKAGDVSARNELLLSQMGSLRFFARKFRRGWIPQEDLVQEAIVKLIRIMHTFDPDLGRFSTFATKRAWGVMHDLVNRGNQIQVIASDYEVLKEMPSRIETDNVEIRDELMVVLKKFTPDEREILSLYSGLDERGPMGWSEIAKLCGVRRQSLSMRIKEAISLAFQPVPRLAILDRPPKPPKLPKVKAVKVKRKSKRPKRCCPLCGATYTKNQRYCPCQPILERRCSKCKNEKPVSLFYRDSRSIVGYRHTCIACELARFSAIRVAKREAKLRSYAG